MREGGLSLPLGFPLGASYAKLHMPNMYATAPMTQTTAVSLKNVLWNMAFIVTSGGG
jgi:hypothetical protein